MDNKRFEEVCKCFTSRRLLYPMSGNDFMLPIKTFMGYIKDFWFVDIRYELNTPFIRDKDYALIEKNRHNLSGETLHSKKPFEVNILTEKYQHTPSGTLFTVNACKGRGYDTFRVALKNPGKHLSVFFYRGDSQGEGGSNFYWLTKKNLKHLIHQLERPALIVSDGSNAMKEFRKFFHKTEISPEEAQEKSTNFKFNNNRFDCIYCLSHRYGPTLVWEVN